MYKLKYIGADKFPKFFTIPTYKEIVRVKDGYAEVKFKQTVDRLLKEGFVLVQESGKKKTKSKVSKKVKEK